MELSNMDRRRIMALWAEQGDLIGKILKGLQMKYELELNRKSTEWENAQQMAEYLAKKQCLVDIQKILTEKI